MLSLMEESVFAIQDTTILVVLAQDVLKVLNSMEELVNAQEILI